jgi:hypothetical protein
MMRQHKAITDYWLKHYLVEGLCGLCGNRGIIDASHITTATGHPVGRKHWCICPNGQALRAQVGDEVP